MQKEKSYPGKKLGVIEEYFSSKGTYIDERGVIRSMFLGQALKDRKTRKVDVHPYRRLKIINVGDTVMGRITNISGIFGYVRIESVNFKPSDREFNGIVYPPRIGKRISMIYREGDYILAKVVSKINRNLHLSIEGNEYGVVYAQCSYCGGELKQIGKSKLRCAKCNNIETRKLSKFYNEMF